MNKKRILSGILAAAMLLCLAGCGKSDVPGGTVSGSEAASTPDSEETAVYKLPSGAASEYELYEAVVDFLNNGFHYSDLKDVLDQNLWFVTRSKMQAEPENIFTLGMKYDEACDLIARLKDKASNMDFLIDEYGEINMDYIDYDAFLTEFPESLRSRIDVEDYHFENFIEAIVYGDELFRDGENPFGTGQTEWEKKSKEELETHEYDDYENWDKDLFLNFPRMYGMELGKYISGDATSMYIEYTEIDGRYYLIAFTYSKSGVGG